MFINFVLVETAHMLGTSFDELIRHHPVLRKDVINTISNVLIIFF